MKFENMKVEIKGLSYEVMITNSCIYFRIRNQKEAGTLRRYALNEIGYTTAVAAMMFSITNLFDGNIRIRANLVESKSG